MDRVDRRRFLGYTAVATGSLLASGLGQARPAVAQAQFTEWGWPLPYEQISTKSRQWLQGKGWWPLNAGFIVMWSGEELLGSIFISRPRFSRSFSFMRMLPSSSSPDHITMKPALSGHQPFPCSHCLDLVEICS